MELSVIIPAYKAEREIEATVRSTFSYLTTHAIEHEILVVSDGSPDRTVEIVKSLTDSIPTLRLLEYTENHGKGFAVRKGMLQAAGQYRLFMDADNSTTIDHIQKMMPELKSGYGVVIASIRAKGHNVLKGEPWYRTILGRVSNIYTQIVILPGIRDTQRGFKVFTKEAATDIFSHALIDRFGFDIEALALARRFGYKIKEVPITWKNDAERSTVKLSAYIQVLLDTLRIKWWLMTGKYPRATMKHHG